MLSRIAGQHSRLIAKRLSTASSFGPKSSSVLRNGANCLQFQNKLVVRWNFDRRLFSTSQGPRTVATTKPQVSLWKTRWRIFARVVKYLRIPAIMVSVYGLGYQQGIIESARSPRLMEDQLLQTVLADVGVKDRKQVQIFSSEDKPVFAMTTREALQGKTIRIGNDIIRVASLFVREELVKAIKAVKDKLPADISTDQLEVILSNNENVTFWRNALYRVEGESLHVPWKYIIVDCPLPNAFVSEILPQRFFITTAMFQNFIENEDELAVVLGHEISHLILGHVSERNNMETMLRTVEVLLLSIDPTEGLISLGVIAGLAWMRRVLMASFSRENESEADELGLKLAAMACYNTRHGAKVMKRMSDHQIKLAGEPSSNSHLLQLLDTHPPSLDRYEKLLKQSETENAEKYSHSTCASVLTRMNRAVWGSGDKDRSES